MPHGKQIRNYEIPLFGEPVYKGYVFVYLGKRPREEQASIVLHNVLVLIAVWLHSRFRYVNPSYRDPASVLALIHAA